MTTKYTVFGDKVSFETTGSDKIHYSYDASGNLFSMSINGTEYYYVRNAQGDITGLIDNAGNLVVSYTYDTWGKLISTTGSLASTIGVRNPYRYRGYRYDNETGLYYLQSRYYNPEWGRFVNADGITGVVGELLALNMFAYTLNNPVNMKDPSGYLTEAATFSNPNLITISTVMAMISGSAAFALMGAVLPYVVIGIGAYALIRAVNSKPTTRASTRTKVLSDVKLKEQRSASYQYAYISNSGGMVKMGGKLTFIKALGGLGIAGASNSIASRYNYNRSKSSDAQRKLEHVGKGYWGIYADSQEAAKALAVVMGYTGRPEVHSSGMYGHYHDITHTFHIWFGGTISY